MLFQFSHRWKFLMINQLQTKRELTRSSNSLVDKEINWIFLMINRKQIHRMNQILIKIEEGDIINNNNKCPQDNKFMIRQNN